MVSQKALPFHYEMENQSRGATAWAGLLAIEGLFYGLGLHHSIGKHIKARPTQGYSDVEQILSLVLLNLAGGSSVDDIDHLEGDAGLSKLHALAAARDLLPRGKALLSRWRSATERSFPSPSAIRSYLRTFDDPGDSSKRGKGKAFVPLPKGHLSGFRGVIRDLLAALQRKSPESVATLDQDATFLPTDYEGALYSYKGEKSYQAFNTYWAEQEMMIHSEFRDGNVPPGYDQLRLFRESLSQLPAGVKTVRLRSDTAGYQTNLLRYCAEGKNERFGRIDFAISHPVGRDFREAVKALPEEAWTPLYKTVGKGRNARSVFSGQEYAEVPYVTNSLSTKRDGPDYRFLALRERFIDLDRFAGFSGEAPGQQLLPEVAEEQFPSLRKLHLEVLDGKCYKIFSIVTTMDWDGEELIRWQRQRCGKSEEMHHILKDELAGGSMPSRHFGACAAWWWISVLALNVMNIFRRQVLPARWARCRPKTLRFRVLAVAGRLVRHARQWAVKLSGHAPAAALLEQAQWSLERFCRLQP